jgi:hypothetical protein
MVAYCSSCREDKGRHTLRGSHSSSHDSRGSDGHRGSMFDVFLASHQIDIPCSIGERLYSGNKTGGEAPRGEWTFSIDVKGGEMITLMYSHGEITQWYNKKDNHIDLIDVD